MRVAHVCNNLLLQYHTLVLRFSDIRKTSYYLLSDLCVNSNYVYQQSMRIEIALLFIYVANI